LNEFKVELVCKTCGKKFTAYKHEKNRRYCSIHCGDIGKRKGEHRICKYCGKDFYVAYRFIKRGPRVYCSILCSNRTKDRKWFKTMVRTPDHCAKIAAALTGENNGMWQGGITPESRIIRSSAAYRKWRNGVLATDNNKCTYCSSPEKLEAHHLDLFSKNKAARFDPDNGVTLCYDCHKDVHSFDPTPDIQSYAFGVV
jgi:DNA-directed RNA polymerase subunit RPC12/RpoP